MLRILPECGFDFFFNGGVLPTASFEPNSTFDSVSTVTSPTDFLHFRDATPTHQNLKTGIKLLVIMWIMVYYSCLLLPSTVTDFSPDGGTSSTFGLSTILSFAPDFPSEFLVPAKKMRKT